MLAPIVMCGGLLRLVHGALFGAIGVDNLPSNGRVLATVRRHRHTQSTSRYRIGHGSRHACCGVRLLAVGWWALSVRDSRRRPWLAMIGMLGTVAVLGTVAMLGSVAMLAALHGDG